MLNYLKTTYRKKKIDFEAIKLMNQQVDKLIPKAL